MSYPLAGIRVVPPGVVAVTFTSPGGVVATAYADSNGVTAITLPDTISAQKTYYLASNGPWNVSVKLAGTELSGQTLTLEDAEVATVSPSVPGVQPGGYVPTSTKRAQYPMGGDGSAGITNFNTPWCVRQTVLLPITPTRYRYRIRNVSLLAGTVTAGALTFAGIWQGPMNLANANWQGDFVSASTQDVGAFSSPADGSQYVSAWITNAGQIQANVPRAVSIGFTGNLAIAWASYPTWAATGAGADTGAGNLTMPASPSFGAAVLDVVLEYEWVGAQKKVTWLGDSITSGITTLVTTALGLTGIGCSHPILSAQRFGYVSENFGIAGTTLQYWANAAAVGWTQRDFATTVPDVAVIALGTNDITGGRTAAQMTSNLQTIIANLKTLGINRVGVATIVPGAFNTAQEAVRQSYNTLTVRACPPGVDFCVDFDAALALNKGFSTTVAAGSNTVNLNTFTTGSPGTLNVASTAGSDSSGAIVVDTAASPSLNVITYTGITATTFTGCVQTVAGSAVLATGQAVHAGGQCIPQWGNTYPHTSTPAGASILAQASNIQ
jgi:lysophospholipase L1-like esterase